MWAWPVMASESTNWQPRDPTPKEYLAELAGNNFELLSKIIWVESGWRIDAQNKTSTASGLAQFLDSTFLTYCVNKYQLTTSLEFKNDPYIQIECMVKMVNDGGLSHWNASRHLWSSKAGEVL